MTPPEIDPKQQQRDERSGPEAETTEKLEKIETPETLKTFDTFVCGICKTAFPAPGFDANQIAQALRQHIAANHQTDVENAAAKALEQNPATTDPADGAPGNPSAVSGAAPIGAVAGDAKNAPDAAPTEEPGEALDGNAPTDATQDAPGDETQNTPGTTPGDEPGNTQDTPGDEPGNTQDTARSADTAPGHGREDAPGDDGRNNSEGRRTPTNPPREPAGGEPPYEPLPREPLPGRGDGGETAAPTPEGARRTGEAKPTGTPDRTKKQNGEKTPSNTPGSPPKGAANPGKDGKPPTKTGNDAKPTANSPGKTPTKGTTKDIAKQAATDPKAAVKQVAKKAVEKGLEHAGSSVGIPPQVTRILIKVVKRGLPIAMGMMLVLLAALGGSALFGGENAEDYVWNVPLAEQLDIPQPYLDAYQGAARRYKIPWTLLAAVGANATYHGRIDPYKQEIPLPTTSPGDGGENFVLLTDAALDGVETYLNPFLMPAGYSVDIVTLPDGTIQSAVNWLDENSPDNNTPIVVTVGGDDDGTPQEFADKVDSLLNRRGLHNHIYWLTFAGDRAKPYNEVLRERDRLRPNLTLVDWAGLVEQRDIFVGADGSVDANAQRLLAGLIAAAIVGNVISAGLPVSSGLSGPGVLPDPTGSCPTLPVPVAGENPYQGAGPLMLTPSALSAAGYNLQDRIQNICTSVDTLAQVLVQTARIVASEEGTAFPSGIANLALRAAGGDPVVSERVHRFWAKVLDNSGVLGDTVQRECELPEQGSLEDQAHVGNMIDSYWRCTLAGVELSSVSSVSVDAAGNVAHRTLNQPEAIARGVEEALSVAWTWSSWGTTECDDTAVHAGVFPLTAAMFARHADDPDQGRCNREENIKAAAKAFASSEAVPVATRGGRWSAAIGGWSLIGPVSGPAGPANFDTVGPWQPLYVGAECTPILVDAILSVGNDATLLSGYTAGQAQEIAFAGTFDEFDTTGGAREGSTLTEDQFIGMNAALDTKLAEVVAAARANPVCAQERDYADEEWLGVVAGGVNGDALTAVTEDGSGPRIPPPTRGDLRVPVAVGDRIAALAGRAASRAGGWGGAAPTTSAYLQRLSTVRIELTLRPLVERELDDGTLPIGYRLVNLAVGYYGGIFIGSDGVKAAGIGFLDETVPFHDEFNSVGQEYGVDPRLLAAVARQESNFNPDAGCNPPGGAFGMMQKQYDTVPTLCGDVRRQIEEAAKMLLDLYGKAGDWKGALWGYNNGALFAGAWAELGGDEAGAREYAIAYYRGARNPSTGQMYCSASGECPRAEIAMTYISEAPGDRSAMLAWLEYQGLFPALVLNTRQTVVNGTECPNVVPRSAIAGKEPLRGGADGVGIRTLCVEAVADAPTPEAARAIIFAFNNLGISYSQDLRSTAKAFDCSSYVSRSYESAGLRMNSGGSHFDTRQLQPWDGGSRPEWIQPISPHLAKPGDLVFPQQGHVAMKLTRGFIIHTSSTGDVSHVTMGGSGYVNPLQTNRVVPEIAPRLNG